MDPHTTKEMQDDVTGCSLSKDGSKDGSEKKVTKFVIPAKVFKQAENTVKTTANTMISNKCDFCCTIADLSCRTEDTISFPERDQVVTFLKTLLFQTLAYKPLPEKALASMKAKGVTPKKQPGEIILIVFAISDDYVHAGLFVPKQFELTPQQFIDFVFKDIPKVKDPSDEVENYVIDEGDSVFSIKHESPLKEVDNLTRKVFTMLKSLGIYKEEEEEDEIYEF